DIPSNFNIEVIPNPANDYIELKIQQNNNSIIEFTIYDIFGNALYQNKSLLMQGIYKYGIDINKFSSGCYIIKAISNNNISTKSFLVIK
ncbi:MAG: T9SS type A sorting domain-containing protein, partial [Candidatus Woesearchaeota archaeon]